VALIFGGRWLVRRMGPAFLEDEDEDVGDVEDLEGGEEP
jgi:hypothetical protein